MSKGKVKWLIERFPEIAPSAEEVFDSLAGLNGREMIIVAVSTVDVGLAHLLSRRLNGSESLINEFLGANADGRAPAGSFGARIDLARLTGLIGDWGHRLLHNLRKLRNAMAHQVRVDFSKGDPQACLQAFVTNWHDHVVAFIKENPNDKRAIEIETFARRWGTLPVTVQAAEESVRMYVCICVGNFHSSAIHADRIKPILPHLALVP